MDVGIVTLWSVNNFGGVLQAYAMQTALEQLGHRAFVVPVTYDLKKTEWRKALERPAKFAFDALKAKSFKAFRNGHLKAGDMTPCTLQECFLRGVQADALVCGSDQIWNPGVCSQADLRRFFFLNFGAPSIRRVSYAASWGTDALDPAVKTEVASCLKRLQAVSVREKSGVTLAAELGCSAAWLPDPTLLLEPAAWEALAEKAEHPPRPNTLFQCEYRWTPCVPFAPVVRQLRDKLGLRPVIPFSRHLIRDAAYTRCMTPPEWVNGIKCASFVVTNSFHGTIFSIIFRRPFIAIPLAGKYAAMNARIYSLAERLGLENRLLTVADPAQINRLSEAPIDWDEVAMRLMRWRAEAKAFLLSALS
jgi:hypothetical protein